MNWAPEYNSFVLKSDAKGEVPNELGRKMQNAECREIRPGWGGFFLFALIQTQMNWVVEYNLIVPRMDEEVGAQMNWAPEYNSFVLKSGAHGGVHK